MDQGQLSKLIVLASVPVLYLILWWQLKMMTEPIILSFLGLSVKWKWDWLWHAVWDSFQMTTPSCSLFMSSKVFVGGRGNEYWIIGFSFSSFYGRVVWEWSSAARVSPDCTQGPEIFPGLHKLGVVTLLIQQSGWEIRKKTCVWYHPWLYFSVYFE